MILSCESIQRNQFLVEQGHHPKDSLLIVTNGSFLCETNNQKYEIEQNEIFFFKSTDIFKRKVTSPLTAIYVIFDDFPLASSQKLSYLNVTRVLENITYLKNAFAEENTYIIQHYIEDILLLSIQNKRSHDPIVYEITEYLKENLQNNLSLDALALKFNISKQWLILRFKKEMNTTPMQFLNYLRLQKAKELILNQQMNLSQIATACGFENQYYFSTAFKKAFKISPSQWRKNMVL